MAKVFSSYSLCPLIEQRNFLGVSEDSQTGYVIVTLAKNIVIRYKLSDQKQVNSWSSKEKLSAPVVYDGFKKQYIGVFNGDSVGFWEDTLVQLNKIKKYKFSHGIHCILTAPRVEPIIVYSNGHVSSLYTDMGLRKAPPPEPPLPLSRKLQDAKLVNIAGLGYVSLLSKENDEDYITFLPVDPDRGKISEIKMKREDKTQLMGHCVIDSDNPQLITFWSDGKIFSLDLRLDDEANFPGRFVAVLNRLNANLPTAMVPISSEHVAIYGAEASSEGASLILFNARFGVILCSNHMKMYSNPPRLWRAGSSQLVLVIGQYLGVVPFELGTQRLASLIGTHKMEPDFTPEVVSWDDDKGENIPDEVDEEMEEPLEKEISSLLSKGLSQASVSLEILPSLIEKKDVEGMRKTVKILHDIPDSFIVQMIVLCLGNLPEMEDLLLSLVQIPLVNDSATLSIVRSSINLQQTLVFLKFLQEQIVVLPGERQILDWAVLLLDSHYQQFILSKDEEVISTLSSLRDLIKENIHSMNEIQVLSSYILRLKRGKGFNQKNMEANKKYSIESFILY